MLHWRSVWEQSNVSDHSKDWLSVAEKLAYLRHVVKDGPVKHVIEGWESGNNYAEAVECLRKHYDHPRLLHENHVKAIIDAPTLKDGTGKELRRLHDHFIQHLRALTAMGYEPPASLITSLIQLKLDQNTGFKWQRYPRKRKGSLIIMTCWHFWIWEHRLLRRSHSKILRAFKTRSPTSTDIIWPMLVTPVQAVNLPNIPCTFAVKVGLFPIRTSWLFWRRISCALTV